MVRWRQVGEQHAVGPPTIAVVSRHPIVLMGLRALLEACLNEAGIVDLAAHDGHLAGLDVVVDDLAGLKEDDGDLQHLVRPNEVVVGVERDRRRDLRDRARAAGVSATFPLSVTAAELVATLRTASAAGRPGPGAPTVEGVVGPLNERETEILALVAAGRTNAQICEELFLSVNTMKTHVQKAYRKIGVNSRSQAILWYHRETASIQPATSLRTGRRPRRCPRGPLAGSG